MRQSIVFAALSLLISSTAFAGQTQPAPKPLSASEVLALVAGAALPEDIAHEISHDGIAFRPDAGYRELLKTAGADPKVFAALDAAKSTADASPDSQSGHEFLQHLAKTSALMNQKKYEDAAKEMLTADVPHLPCPECGFVMGEVFLQIEDWERAEAVYRKVLDEAPGFPEAHARLSLVYHRERDGQSAQTEARAALLRNPDDPEAHKVEGLALVDMQNYPSAIAEYREALRLKPDYALVHYDLGVVYGSQGKADDAIAEYRTAVRIQPDLVDALYNLGNELVQKNDIEAALLEFREAKKYEPENYDVRQNLGSALMNNGHAVEAVAEFRELVKMYPESEMAEYSLGLGLEQINQLDEATAAFVKVAADDPSDPKPHKHLGEIYETQDRDNDALKEYAAALKLDPSMAEAYKGIGRILVHKQEFTRAQEELKQAAQLMIGDAEIHSLYAQALAGSGDLDGAVAEFKQAAALTSKNAQILIQLGGTYEKQGHWPEALDAYQRAAAGDASIDIRGKMWRSTDRDPQKEYEEAKKRYDAHLAELRAAGKSAEATALEAQLRDTAAKQGVSAKIDTLMMEGFSAMRATRIAEARTDLKQVIDLEQQLTPRDPRLVTALDYLGMTYVRVDNDTARDIFERELKAASELYGADSPSLTPSLTSLGNIATMQKDYATATNFYFRAVDLNEKYYGESSDKVANALVQAVTPYFVQQQYEKAEPYLLRAVRIDQALFGKDHPSTLIPVSALCGLYDQWQKPDKLAACDQQLIAIVEKEYGATSPVLVQVLSGESGALRKIGKTQEADAVDQRVAQIRGATMKTP